jgi:hypothetical protein
MPAPVRHLGRASAGVAGFAFVSLAAPSCSEHRTMAPQPSAAPRVVAFAPGIRLDYRVPQVEIEAEVILRHGALELFAYSKAPTPKEHESILLLDVPAETVYQALGLIGLTPGSPPRYDPTTQTVLPPSGDAVDVLVRYERGGRIVESSACGWMLDLATRRPMARMPWLFAGSRRLSDGTFAANVEGTVVTVVDFDSAVLTPPAAHSSSDAELWLAANTEAIPPVGTRVTLLLRPAKP